MGSRLVGSDRNGSGLTGNSEVIHLAEKRAFRGSGRFKRFRSSEEGGGAFE